MKSLFFYGLLLIQSYTVLGKHNKMTSEMQIVMHEMQNCPDHSGPNRYANSSLTNFGKGTVLANADWVIKEPARKVTGVCIIRKCTSSLLSDCEHFLKVDIPDLCRLFVEKGQLWSPLYASITPPIKCPVRKGIYRQRNGSFDVNAVQQYKSMIPSMDTYFWRFTVRMFNAADKKEFFCFSCAAECRSIRERQRNLGV